MPSPAPTRREKDAEGHVRDRLTTRRQSPGALRSIGFEVIAGDNLPRRALLGKFGELIQRLDPGDTAFFFFSGHGVAVDGVNYVLPADMPDIAAGQATLLKGDALSEPYIMSELAGRDVSVAVLDAWRTNPFRRTGDGGIGGDRGLAPPPQVKGVFSLYAASAGQSVRAPTWTAASPVSARRLRPGPCRLQPGNLAASAKSLALQQPRLRLRPQGRV